MIKTEEKAITLISLVVTIVILIILAGVSLNLTLGENGIITKSKQAKENILLAQVEEETALNELYEQIELGGASGDISYDAIAKLNNFKKSIANYIEEAGGIKPEYTANESVFGDSIKGIVKEVTKTATATAEDIAKDKTAWVNGSLIVGTNTGATNSEWKTGKNTCGSSTARKITLGFKPKYIIIYLNAFNTDVSTQYDGFYTYNADLSEGAYTRVQNSTTTSFPVLFNTTPTSSGGTFLSINDDGFAFFPRYASDMGGFRAIWFAQ